MDDPAFKFVIHTPELVVTPVGPPQLEPGPGTTTLPAGTGVKDADAVGDCVPVAVLVPMPLGVKLGVRGGDRVGVKEGVTVAEGVPVLDWLAPRDQVELREGVGEEEAELDT